MCKFLSVFRLGYSDSQVFLDHMGRNDGFRPFHSTQCCHGENSGHYGMSLAVQMRCSIRDAPYSLNRASSFVQESRIQCSPTVHHSQTHSTTYLLNQKSSGHSEYRTFDLVPLSFRPTFESVVVKTLLSFNWCANEPISMCKSGNLREQNQTVRTIFGRHTSEAAFLHSLY